MCLAQTAIATDQDALSALFKSVPYAQMEYGSDLFNQQAASMTRQMFDLACPKDADTKLAVYTVRAYTCGDAPNMLFEGGCVKGNIPTCGLPAIVAHAITTACLTTEKFVHYFPGGARYANSRNGPFDVTDHPRVLRDPYGPYSLLHSLHSFRYHRLVNISFAELDDWLEIHSLMKEAMENAIERIRNPDCEGSLARMFQENGSIFIDTGNGVEEVTKAPCAKDIAPQCREVYLLLEGHYTNKSPLAPEDLEMINNYLIDTLRWFAHPYPQHSVAKLHLHLVCFALLSNNGAEADWHEKNILVSACEKATRDTAANFKTLQAVREEIGNHLRRHAEQQNQRSLFKKWIEKGTNEGTNKGTKTGTKGKTKAGTRKKKR